MWEDALKVGKLVIILGSVAIILASVFFILGQNNFSIVPKAEIYSEFFIKIPKINLAKSIVPNVDPRDENIYKAAFEQGVAHGLGTRFPDEIGNTYLYAHSTGKVKNIERHAGWFTELDEVEIGDTFSIVYGPNEYFYSIASRDIIDPTATGVYTAYAPVQLVTLQTCYPRGTVEQRLIMKALLLDTVAIGEGEGEVEAIRNRQQLKLAYKPEFHS